MSDGLINETNSESQGLEVYVWVDTQLLVGLNLQITMHLGQDWHGSGVGEGGKPLSLGQRALSNHTEGSSEKLKMTPSGIFRSSQLWLHITII